MKRLALLFLCIMGLGFAQNTPDPDVRELGLILVGLNGSPSMSFGVPYVSPITVATGGFYRLNIGKWALRGTVVMQDNSGGQTPPSGSADFPTSAGDATSFDIRGGAQYRLLGKGGYLYGFADLGFIAVRTEGEVTGGQLAYNDWFDDHSRGVSGALGLGARIWLFSTMSISPEIYYNGTSVTSQTRFTGKLTGEMSRTTSGRSNLDLCARLILSVGF